VFFHDETGRLWKIPACWTDVVAEDPFVVVAAGRSPFRATDLLKLAELVDALRQEPSLATPVTHESVKEFLP
jgi:hypothetical protein